MVFRIAVARDGFRRLFEFSPFRGQNGPKRLNKLHISSQDSPRGPQKVNGGDDDGERPRSLFRTVPEAPRDSDSFPVPSMTSQEGSQTAQDGAKTAQEAPRTAQEGSNRPPKRASRAPNQ